MSEVKSKVGLQGNVVSCNGVPSNFLNQGERNPEMENNQHMKTRTVERGRLQFYLDGKVVLELCDLRENGKSWWVPANVQKTFWPPYMTPSSIAGQESSASASCSISDESSIQSQAFPWPRGTRWKNPCPSKLQPTFQAFCFRHVKHKRCQCNWRLCRKPFSPWERCDPHKKTEEALSKECDQRKVKRTKAALVRSSIAGITCHLLESALKNKRLLSSSWFEQNEFVSPRKRLAARREGDDALSGNPHYNLPPNPNKNVLKKAKGVVPLLQPQQVAAMGTAKLAVVKVYDRMNSYSIDSLLSSKERLKLIAGNSDSPHSSMLSSSLGKIPSSNVCLVGTTSDSNCKNQVSQPLHPTCLVLPVSVAMSATVIDWDKCLPRHHSRPGSYPPLAHTLSTPSLTIRAQATSPSWSLQFNENVGSMKQRDSVPKIVASSEFDDAEDAPLNLTTVRRAREHS